MNFPGKWNIPLQLSHMQSLKVCILLSVTMYVSTDSADWFQHMVAKALLPVLQQEQEHMKHPKSFDETRKVKFAPDVVSMTCMDVFVTFANFALLDTCMTFIFAGSWMCRLCGRKACSECFTQVSKLTVGCQGATDAELRARREKHAETHPFFLFCTKQNSHRASDFWPVWRFSNDNLENAGLDMRALLKESTQKEVTEINISDSITDTSAGVSNDAGASDQSALPSPFIPSQTVQYFTDL